MPSDRGKPNFFYRFLHKIYRLKPMTWVLSKILRPLDRIMFKLSKGKRSAARFLGGVHMAQITCIGAKSGLKRTLPLITIPYPYPDGKDRMLVASNWGGQKNPSWYYNIKTNPEIQIMEHGKTYNATATLLDNEKYDEAFAWACEHYSGYKNYKERTSRKKIPIFHLTLNRD